MIKKAKKRAKRQIKKLRPASRLTKTELKKEFSGEKVETLLKKGKERGFLTYPEILAAFPHIEYNVIFLEDIYSRLETAGVHCRPSHRSVALTSPATPKTTKIES